MDKTPVRHSKPAPGFTVLELVVVIGIFALLAMIAAPAIHSIIPSFSLRQAAKSTSSLLYVARMTASNTQKPSRAVVDCQTAADPCRLSIFTAVFDTDGELTGWRELPASVRELNRNVEVKGDNKAVSGSPDKLFWAVFMPSGRVRASHDPLQWKLSLKGQSNGPSWSVSVAKGSGSTTMKRD